MQSQLTPQGVTFADGTIVSVVTSIDYEPAAVLIRTAFGNTPRLAENSNGITDEDNFYGVSSSIMRWFCPTVLTSPPSNSRRFVVSCNDITGLTAAAANAYWRFCIKHEIDSQIAKGQANLPDWKDDMATAVALGIPGLTISLTADCFENAKKNPEDYVVPGVKYLMVDFDGISPSATGYHNYLGTLAKVIAFARKHSYIVGIGECGTNLGTFDKDGSLRAAWIRALAYAFDQTGLIEYCLFWESNGQAGSDFLDAPSRFTIAALMLFSF